MRSLRLGASVLLAAILYATQVSLALYIELPRRSEARLPNLLTRAPKRPNATSTLDIDGGYYHINITLGGKNFSVLIDTGSSDLWVAGTVPNANDTGTSAQVQYAIGSAGGPVKTAQLTMLGYTVSNQAFIEMTPSGSAPDGFGLVGLGPSQDTSMPNFITVLLSRPNDTHETYTGELTISEILPEFQNISSQPNVSVSVLQSGISSDQHFSILLDPDGIIGPDGFVIKTTSNASYAPSRNQSRLQVVFDTGDPLP